MVRHEDWNERLVDAIAAREATPFSHGDFDCCMAAADNIIAMTGKDWMAAFRGKYRSAAGASRLMQTDGKGTLLKTLISLAPQMGSKRIPPAFATRGDLVVTKLALHDECRGQACGTCVGRGRAVFPGETGWVQLPMSAWCAAFRI